ncbi:hypothetical protein L2E82_14517 [Cichorium intybus]|uniref:Uncharacterized protein n=1 Tax=Cichorium intybus TaxID=13427 RepID=A0ACB9F129_CICIN|nr:hypothetical protein L2E82_14517 [Cichorium intybus]
MRRRQPANPRMNVDNESQRSMVEVKLENPPDFQMDNNNAGFRASEDWTIPLSVIAKKTKFTIEDVE